MRIARMEKGSFPAFCAECVKRYRGAVVVIALLTCVVSAASLVFPWGLKIIIDDVIPASDVRRLWLVAGVLAALVVLKFLCDLLKEYLCYRTVERITMDVRQDVCASLIALTTGRVEQRTIGECVSRVMADADAMKRFFVTAIGDLLSACMTFLVVYGILLAIAPGLTCMFSALIPLFVLMQYRAMRLLKAQAHEVREQTGQVSGYVGEMVQGMRVVKAFAMAGYVLRRFRERQAALFTASMRVHVTRNCLWLLSECFVSLSLIGVVCVSVLAIVKGTMTVGTFIAYYSYLGMLFEPVIRMISINTTYHEAAASFERGRALYEEEKDAAFQARTVPVRGETPCRGKITFDRVSFSYVPDVPVLADVSFTIAPGEHVAVVGPSGSGKSTILNLLMRLYEPQSGMISIDDMPLRDITIDHHRRSIATVFQDDFIFSGTIREAIACGRDDLPMAEVIAAAERAYAHTFITALPRGYDTVVGERGVTLSGGERQRILIARALARDARILVLDEATSAVDAEVGILIQHAVREMIRGRTALIVAHHFLSVRDVDKIIVVDDGGIAAVGTHDELLATSDLYLRLFERQFEV